MNHPLNNDECELLRSASGPALECFRSWCARLPAAGQAHVEQRLRAGDHIFLQMRAGVDGSGLWSLGLVTVDGDAGVLANVNVVPPNAH